MSIDQTTDQQTPEQLADALTAETEPKYLDVPVAGNERLEQLLAVYPDLKAAADEATKRLDAVKAAIKAELQQAAPDSRAIQARSGATTLRLVHSESWRLDSTRLKAADPATWVRFAKKSGSWTLKSVPTQGGGQ